MDEEIVVISAKGFTLELAKTVHGDLCITTYETDKEGNVRDILVKKDSMEVVLN